MKQLNPDILRLLDANANRAVEGMRVLEESARMLLDNDALTSILKHLRHDLVSMMNGIAGQDGARLLEARASERDVLRQGETASEAGRESIVSVLRANAGRAQEALRAIEEYGKLVKPGFSSGAKDIRFSLYDIEKELVLRFMRSHPGLENRLRIAVVLDASAIEAGHMAEKALVSIDAGATAIGYAFGGASDSDFFDGLAALVEVVGGRVPVIAFGRPGLARAAGTDIFHAEMNEDECSAYRTILGEKIPIGYYRGMMDDYPVSAEFITSHLTGGDGNDYALAESFLDNEAALPIPVAGCVSPDAIVRACDGGWRCFLLHCPSCSPADISRLAEMLENASPDAAAKGLKDEKSIV